MFPQNLNQEHLLIALHRLIDKLAELPSNARNTRNRDVLHELRSALNYTPKKGDVVRCFLSPHTARSLYQIATPPRHGFAALRSPDRVTPLRVSVMWIVPIEWCQ